jgi:hypothetical protein
VFCRFIQRCGLWRGIPTPPNDLKSEVSLGTGDKLLWYGEIDRESCAGRLLVVQEFQHFRSDHWGTDQNGKYFDGARLLYADALQL